MPTTASDPLSTTLFALADPTRRAILARLSKGDATVKELSAPFQISGPAVSKHLRILERAGLITQGRAHRWRPRRLRAEPIKRVVDWAEQYRQFWDAAYNRLDSYLDELQRDPKEGEHDRDA